MSIIPTTILDHLDTIAVISGGLFAGSAFFVSFTETPALHEFGLNEHWRYFPLMYKRAGVSQPSLIAIAAAAGIAHATRIEGSPFDRNLWLIAGSTFLAMLPFTLICIGPTNNKIIEDNKSVKSGNESKINTGTKKELLNQWAVLHLVRTVATVAGFGVMVFGATRHSSLVLRW
jgi:uncharacterized membrane protein